MPPEAVIVWLYPTPTVPDGSVDGDKVMAGGAVIEKMADELAAD